LSREKRILCHKIYSTVPCNLFVVTMSLQTSTTYFRFPTLPCKPMLPILLYTVNAIMCEPKVASIILRLLLLTNSTTLPVEAPVLPATTQYSVSTSMQKTSVNSLTEGRPVTSRILYCSLRRSAQLASLPPRICT